MLRGIRKGARLYAVDPRRTSSAQWADAWLGLDVGSDISLANAVAREIIQAGLVNEEFVRRATTGYEAYAASVQPYTVDRAERDTGVPGLIRQLAHAYARADRAQICWTLGITEHHNAADNVFALINLALLTGHRPLPVLVCVIEGSFHRQDRRHPEASENRSPRAAHADGNGVLAAARFTRTYGYPGQ